MPSKLKEQIMQLSPEERLELADELYASLPFAPEEIAVIERELAEHDAHPETSIPWEKVKAELEAKYK